MSDHQKLRIYVDPSSVTVDGWCYILRYDERPLGEVAKELDLYEGMPVVLYYSDSIDEFEYEGILSYRTASPVIGRQWMAQLNDQTFRRIRG
jgi:hypothetical protein